MSLTHISRCTTRVVHDEPLLCQAWRILAIRTPEAARDAGRADVAPPNTRLCAGGCDAAMGVRGRELCYDCEVWILAEVRHVHRRLAILDVVRGWHAERPGHAPEPAHHADSEPIHPWHVERCET